MLVLHHSNLWWAAAHIFVLSICRYYAVCPIGSNSVILANKYAAPAIHTAVSRRLEARWLGPFPLRLQLHTPREHACTRNKTTQSNVSTKTRLVGKIVNDHMKMSKNTKIRVLTADHKNHERSSLQVVHHPCYAVRCRLFSFCAREEVRIRYIACCPMYFSVCRCFYRRTPCLELIY